MEAKVDLRLRGEMRELKREREIQLEVSSHETEQGQLNLVASFELLVMWLTNLWDKRESKHKLIAREFSVYLGDSLGQEMVLFSFRVFLSFLKVSRANLNEEADGWLAATRVVWTRQQKVNEEALQLLSLQFFSLLLLLLPLVMLVI